MSVDDINNDYYHINRITEWSSYKFLNKGDEINVGESSNPYFQYFETQPKQILVTAADGSKIFLKGVNYFEHVKRRLIVPDNIVDVALNLAKHQVAYIRELIWEDVRRREFPDLPSRQRCIWLIPSLDGVKYWLSKLEEKEDFQVLKVKVDGRIHKASEEYLIGDSESMVESIMKAKQYWQGIDTLRPQTEEILFEGHVRVLEVISSDAYT